MNKFILTLFLASLFVHAYAQQPALIDLVKENQAEWMIGHWSGKTPDGQVMKFSLTWDLDQKVIAHHGDSFGVVSKGYSGVNPVTGEVQHLAYDSKGGMVTGTWEMEGEKPLLKITWRMPDGQSGQAVLVHIKVDENTMRVLGHDLNAQGEKVNPARWDLIFKRTQR